MTMPSSAAANTPLRLALYALLAAALVWPALAVAASTNEFRDAQVMLLHEHAALDSVKRFGELPLWNPWYCGGMYALGAPQARFASPTFLATLWLGAQRAEVLVAFLFAVLGMEGTYRWLAPRVRSPLASALIAPVFALSGHVAVSFFRGWTNFWGFELVPWILCGVSLAARGRTSGVLLAAVAFAAMLGFGGTFAAPLVAVAVIVEALRALSELGGSARVRAVGMLALTASFMAAVSLFRLLPVAETLEAAPRIMAGTPGHAPKAVLSMLVGTLEVKNGDVDLAGQFYVGGIFLGLAALGGSDRRSLRAMLVAVIFVWLAAGYARKPALFALLRELPVLSALRYPERFLWLAILFACEPAARSLEKIPRLGEGARWRYGAVAVLGAGLALTLWGQITTFHRAASARTLGALQAAPEDAAFRQSRGNRWLAAHVQAQNLGSLSCWEVHPVVQSARLRGDLAAEEYLADATAGTASRTSWSPNRVAVKAVLMRATRLLVNQNWHPGWRASVGTVVSEEGLLAVDLPAGEHDVVLTFAPRSARTGAWVSLVAAASLAALAWRLRRGLPAFARRHLPWTLALATAPWVVFGAMEATRDEPRWPAPAPRNANGAPALVASMPDTTAALGARFDVPVVLEGVTLRGPDDRQNVYVDLYLRRTAPVPRTTAVFVHVERREKLPRPPKDEETADKKKKDKEEPQDFFNADHQVVARSFFLSDAPEGALVDDALGVHLDHAAPGQWDVFVGLGHVSGRRGRSKITDAGNGTVQEDRVRVGSFVVR
jgi:hypothetical protein